MTSIESVAGEPILLPAGARIPIGCPDQWLAAAIAASWQCECTSGFPVSVGKPCGRSHLCECNQRCGKRAAGTGAARLILAPDAGGALRLMCEPCAAGHARTRKRNVAPTPASLEQESLFEV